MGRRGNRSGVPSYTSIKNQVNVSIGSTGIRQDIIIAKAVTSPSPTVNSDVSFGCAVQNIWIAVDGCGLGGTGVLNNMNFYLFKNPGANLTPPNPIAWGTSNEKKYVFRSWKFMIMRNQDGNTPFHWEGWVKVPKPYQRMGTDDQIHLSVINTSGVTGHFSLEAIYKWKR